MKHLPRILLFLLVAALFLIAHGCASEGVGKGPAAQSVGIGAAVAAGAATVLTFGWSLLIGFAAGFARLFVADSIPEGGGGTTVVHSGVPWWILFLVILWLVRAHLWDWITKKGQRWDALLRMLKIRTHKTPITPKE